MILIIKVKRWWNRKINILFWMTPHPKILRLFGNTSFSITFPNQIDCQKLKIKRLICDSTKSDSIQAFWEIGEKYKANSSDKINSSCSVSKTMCNVVRLLFIFCLFQIHNSNQFTKVNQILKCSCNNKHKTSN